MGSTDIRSWSDTQGVEIAAWLHARGIRDMTLVFGWPEDHIPQPGVPAGWVDATLTLLDGTRRDCTFDKLLLLQTAQTHAAVKDISFQESLISAACALVLTG
jgi:hypothetical protein